ncbi:hypothetical protein BGZ65_005992 [Modicella reniformis]|uniref:Uncharacterized protein n=1 Tax=Modicella reniformis TaxID=1440133 RepID=A0A9P6IWW4_9FUNG|nr:hypothetical protein BGZ65_005992 [Modicella reniformis]
MNDFTFFALESYNELACDEVVDKAFLMGSPGLPLVARALKNKDLQPAEHTEHGAWSEFYSLAAICRKLVPMSQFEDSFISLFELDLIAVFWESEGLKTLLQGYAKEGFPDESRR